jgi:hypothetical protein
MMKQRTEEEYYLESRRLREETMRMADALKDNPMRFVVTNVITMDVEITKSDLKTIQTLRYHRPEDLRCRDSKS